MPYLLYHGNEVIQFIDAGKEHDYVARSALELFRTMVDENPANSQTRFTHFNPVAHVISPEEAVRVYGYQKSKLVMQNLIDWYSERLLGNSEFVESTVRFAKLRDQAQYHLHRIVEGDLIDDDFVANVDEEDGFPTWADQQSALEDNYVDADFIIGELNGFNYKPNKPGEKFYNGV